MGELAFFFPAQLLIIVCLAFFTSWNVLEKISSQWCLLGALTDSYVWTSISPNLGKFLLQFHQIDSLLF